LSVNYNIAVRTNRLQQVINAIDAGFSNGFLKLLDSGGAAAASFQLARPCGTIVGGVLTFSGLSLIDPAAAGGAAVAGLCTDGSGNTIISGLTVNAAFNPDIILSPTSIIAAGQTVAITAATITGN
jgi:hypothetical protein